MSSIMSSKDSPNPPPLSEQPPEKKQKTECDLDSVETPDSGLLCSRYQCLFFKYNRNTTIKLDPHSREYGIFKPLCVSAMDYHDTVKHTNYQFVELIKAKGQPFGTDVIYSVFFIGRNQEDNTAKTFEVRVQYAKLEDGVISPYRVWFCKEKASKGQLVFEGDDNGSDGDSDEGICLVDYDSSEDDEVDKVSNCSDHSMNDGEMDLYMAAVNDSEGFEVPDIGGRRVGCGLISSVNLYSDYTERFKEMGDAALAVYNDKNKSDYVFLDLEKANERGCCWIVYYLTLVGRSPNLNNTKCFQARVQLGIPEDGGDCQITVDFCREKKGF